jgi:chromate reductase
VNVLGVSGSLRRDSYNRTLLHVAQEVAPAGMEIDLFHLHAIPVFDRDLEAKGDPEPVWQLKAAIRSADALLIATPEYNYGIPGVLKRTRSTGRRSRPESRCSTRSRWRSWERRRGSEARPRRRPSCAGC